jgi:cysteine sulfinate desulfinase/cysteine desulfurase-like protein
VSGRRLRTTSSTETLACSSTGTTVTLHPNDADELGVDLLTLAGHKFYATKGVGALYVRADTPISRLLHGADQEQGLRPGTENVPAIVVVVRWALRASGSSCRDRPDCCLATVPT